MNEFLDFLGNSPVLGFFVCLFLITLVGQVFQLVQFLFRCVNILVRGWPPAHLNADGRFKQPKKGKDKSDETAV